MFFQACGQVGMPLLVQSASKPKGAMAPLPIAKSIKQVLIDAYKFKNKHIKQQGGRAMTTF